MSCLTRDRRSRQSTSNSNKIVRPSGPQHQSTKYTWTAPRVSKRYRRAHLAVPRPRGYTARSTTSVAEQAAQQDSRRYRPRLHVAISESQANTPDSRQPSRRLGRSVSWRGHIWEKVTARRVFPASCQRSFPLPRVCLYNPEQVEHPE
jgi:hypothetical protein